MTDSIETPRATNAPRRVQAVVALRLLEAMRDRDLPGEILEDEDPTRTMPRRFGLSDVVERQIRQYKGDARRRVRLSDEEVGGLFRFVIRRPDGAQIFDDVGQLLASGESGGRWARTLPRRVRLRFARSAARRSLKKLFGRTIGGFARGPFVIEGRALFFIENDPGGDACHLLSGFCRQVIENTVGGSAHVLHSHCQSRGDPFCRWEGELVEEPAELVEPPPAAAES